MEEKLQQLIRKYSANAWYSFLDRIAKELFLIFYNIFNVMLNCNPHLYPYKFNV